MKLPAHIEQKRQDHIELSIDLLRSLRDNLGIWLYCDSSYPGILESHNFGEYEMHYLQ